MADEAAVKLSAIDNVTGPVEAAITALKKYGVSVDQLAAVGAQTGTVAMRTAAGINEVGNASSRSVNSHRAAHQALGLVSGSLVELAGGSAAASSAVRVLDSVMFQMAASGGAVSIGFIAIASAAAAVGYAFKSVAEAGKKEDESLKSLTEQTIKAVLQLDHLDEVQRKIAAVGAAQMGRAMEKTREDIQKTDIELKNLSDRITRMSKAEVIMPIGEAPVVAGGGDISDLVVKQRELSDRIPVLNALLRDQTKEFNNATAASRGVGAGVRAAAVGATEMSESMRRSNAEIDRHANAVEAYYKKIEEFSLQVRDIVVGAFSTMAVGVGEVIGEMIASGEMNWKKFLLVIVDAVLTAAMQIVIAWMAVSQFMNAIIPGWGGISIGAGIAALLAIGIARGAAHSLLGGGASKAASASAASGASAVSAGAGGGEAAGAGGRAVSSAQQSVTNNIVVNLPVQALDLSTVSDIQLKSLANRVGRVIAEAAGQGQFSLVGA